MAGDEDRFSFLGEDADEVLEFHASLGIKTRGGFVENEHGGIMEQRAAQAQPLTLAFGELVDHARPQHSKVREIHHLAHALLAVGSFEVVGPGEEIEVFHDTHVLVGAETVRHPAQLPAHLLRSQDHVMAEHGDASGAWIIKRGEDAHGGRLARAIGADKSHHCSLGNLETHPIHGLQTTEEPVQIFHFDGDVRIFTHGDGTTGPQTSV